jgi:hypothetical protein
VGEARKVDEEENLKDDRCTVLLRWSRTDTIFDHVALYAVDLYARAISHEL